MNERRSPRAAFVVSVDNGRVPSALHRTRPPDQTSPTAVDRLIDVTATLLLIAIIALTAATLPGLPDKVPTNFDASGQPNSWGSKWTILFFPLISLAFWVGLGLVARLGPQHYNFPWAITEANAQSQYRLARRFIRLLRAECILMFGIIETEIIIIAKQGTPFGPTLLPILLAPLAITIGGYLFLALRARAPEQPQ